MTFRRSEIPTAAGARERERVKKRKRKWVFGSRRWGLEKERGETRERECVCV